MLLRRWGFRPEGEQHDLALVQATEKALAETRIGIDRFFFDWFGGRQRGQTPESATYDRPEFADFKAAISAYAPRFETMPAYFADPEPCSIDRKSTRLNSSH